MGSLVCRASRALNQGIRALVCALGMAMAAIVAVQVFFRYGLNHSLFWSEELARILLVWLTFLGATVAYFHHAHPGIDSILRRLPPGWQKAAALVSSAVALGFFAVMVGYGIQFAWFVSAQITPALGWPRWTVMAAVPVSGAIFFLHGLAMVLETIGKQDP